MPSTKITLLRKTHNKEQIILIHFRYNDKLIDLVKTLPRRQWSASLKCWHIPYSEKAISLIMTTFKGYSIENRISQKVVNSIKPVLNKKRKTLILDYIKYLKGKRYSVSTVDTYSFLVSDFLRFYSNRDLHELTFKHVEQYIEDVFIKRNYSISTQRQLVSALKLFKNFCPELAYDQLELERPKRDRKLPTVISKEEIINLIRVTKNLKHRAIIALIYSCGLRVSELIHLELRHIDIQRRQLLIRNAKGRKDRYVILAESFLPLLLNYIHTYEPKQYFVEGRQGKQYSAGSIRKFLRTSCNQAGIRKRVTPHTLRHSYATHLLENGIDLRYIQELLGHAKPETTMIYTHVAKKDLLSIKSPLDIAVKQFMASEKEPSKVTLSGI